MSNLRKRDDDVGECSNKAYLHPSIAMTDEYQVFISHRGIEMKRKFASHLYEALQLRGIKAFLDMKELPEGDDVRPFILQAARAAIIGVPIFTANYAESRWCLDELVELMKSKVIPVFYNVKSEDLRREDGPFAKAIKAHRDEGKRDEGTIGRWESALHEASWLEGFRLETYNQCEAELIKHLSAKVVEEVCDRVPVDAVPNAVGLQERARHVVPLLCLENQQYIYFVLLWGMGGMGKTTLAREIYHKHRYRFEAASFVERWEDEKSIQDRLRRDLLHHKQEVVMRDDIAKGKTLLQEGLRRKKVLIVLDDMKDLASIEDVIDPKSMHKGSRILVTSRDQRLFPPENYFSDVFRGNLYEVKQLNDQESLQLFCLHAFKKPAPESSFEEQAKAVVEGCNGLPLSLELLGRHLSGCKEKEVWKEATKVLQSSKGIQDKMMISYKALSKDEQEMFLDVACFLIGERESSAKHFWKGLGYASSSGLKRLTELCLVKVYHDGVKLKLLTMHDVLRDFGRSIVGKSWSRLWDDEDLSKVLRTKQGLDQIRGIATSKKLNVGLLSQMHSLELLFLNATESLDGGCEGLKAEIKWLKCRELDHLVEFFQPESLVVLELCQCLTHNTNLPSFFGQLKRLGVLYMPFCQMLEELPEDFGCLKSLEELDISFSRSLTQLPSSFGQLTMLRILRMMHCYELKMLPEDFGSLKRLEELDISYLDSLTQLPSSFGQLTMLRMLSMSGCYRLEMLPEDFGSLERLEELDISYSNSLTQLPSSFGQLTMLRMLSMPGCHRLEMLPEDFGCLKSLEELDISGSGSLTQLPSSFGQLTMLRMLSMWDCHRLEMLLGDFRSLEMTVQNVLDRHQKESHQRAVLREPSYLDSQRAVLRELSYSGRVDFQREPSSGSRPQRGSLFRFSEVSSVLRPHVLRELSYSGSQRVRFSESPPQ